MSSEACMLHQNTLNVSPCIQRDILGKLFNGDSIVFHCTYLYFSLICCFMLSWRLRALGRHASTPLASVMCTFACNRSEKCLLSSYGQEPSCELHVFLDMGWGSFFESKDLLLWPGALCLKAKISSYMHKLRPQQDNLVCFCRPQHAHNICIAIWRLPTIMAM